GPCGAQSRRVLPGARANVRANRCLFQADQRLWMHRAPLRTGPSRVSARGQAVSRTVIAPLGSTILYARQNLELRAVCCARKTPYNVGGSLPGCALARG